MFIATFAVILLIITDQITKIASVSLLKPIGSVDIIKNVLSLTYVENRGAAFGILQNQRWIFIVFTIAIIALIIGYSLKYKPSSKIYNTSVVLIIAGGVGNLIDRVFRGFVVDMIEVTFINYPVFNFADCCVVIGAMLFALYILKYDQKADNKNGDA